MPKARQPTEGRNQRTEGGIALKSILPFCTGITNHKEATGDTAISLVIKLVSLVQTYAEETGNSKLPVQMQITAGAPANMGDNELVLNLRDLHRLIAAVGQQLVKYNVTPVRLDALKAAIDKFDSLKHTSCPVYEQPFCK